MVYPNSFIMKRYLSLICFSLTFLLLSCENTSLDLKPTEEPAADLNLAEIDLSDLALDWDLTTSTFDIGFADKAQLSVLTDQIVSAFLSEGDKGPEWFEMEITANQTTLYFGGEGPSIQKANGCNAAGWNTVASDEGLCRSEECVRGRLETAYQEAGNPGVGECVDTRVHRSLTGASVCWKKGKC